MGISIPEHTRARLTSVDCDMDGVNQPRTKFHLLEATTLLELPPGGLVRLTINGRECFLTATIIAGRQLVESFDQEGHRKTFFLLPDHAGELERPVDASGKDHRNMMPSMEYLEWDPDAPGIYVERLHLYTAEQLISVNKDDPEPR